MAHKMLAFLFLFTWTYEILAADLPWFPVLTQWREASWNLRNAPAAFDAKLETFVDLSANGVITLDKICQKYHFIDSFAFGCCISADASLMASIARPDNKISIYSCDNQPRFLLDFCLSDTPDLFTLSSNKSSPIMLLNYNKSKKVCRVDIEKNKITECCDTNEIITHMALEPEGKMLALCSPRFLSPSLDSSESSSESSDLLGENKISILELETQNLLCEFILTGKIINIVFNNNLIIEQEYDNNRYIQVFEFCETDSTTKIQKELLKIIDNSIGLYECLPDQNCAFLLSEEQEEIFESLSEETKIRLRRNIKFYKI